MILQLDSNYRNKNLYPNICNFVIEINGTPPLDINRPDSRCFFGSYYVVTFSFFYFEKTRNPIPYTCINSNSIFFSLDSFYNIYFENLDAPDLLESYLERYYRLVSETNNFFIFQNNLVGYVVKDLTSKKSAIIISSFRSENDLINIQLSNDFCDSANGLLEIVNPVYGIDNFLLVNGFCFFNQTNTQQFFSDEGVNTSSLVINLTQKWSTIIKSTIQPFRIIEYVSDGSKRIQKQDYMAIMTNYERYRFNFKSIIIDDINFLFQNCLYKYSIEIPDDLQNLLQVGDVLYSTEGEFPKSDVQVFPLVLNKRLVPKLKIGLIIIQNKESKKLATEILFPGAGLSSFSFYEMFCERIPEIKLTLQSLEVAPLAVKVENKLLNERYFCFLTLYFTSIPVYFAILGYIQTKNILYLERRLLDQENLPVPYPDILLCINRICFLPYVQVYPNLVIPCSNFQQKCYSIMISSITLPNLPLCGTKFLLADFPFVFVTFGNVTTFEDKGTTNVSTITSNNPNAQQATFICPIANIRNPEIVKYVVVRSNQINRIKLNFAENIRFRVYLPDGDEIVFSRRFFIDFANNTVSSSNICSSQNFLVNGDTISIYPIFDELFVSATFFLSDGDL